MTVGVLLNGCGHRDGSEVREAVFCLAALEEAGLPYTCLGIDAPQASVVDHASGQTVGEQRSMLSEAARIARGHIVELNRIGPSSLTALVIPGGFGSAKNLCNYAEKGREMEVRTDVANLIRACYEARKPIGAVCIAPIILSKVLGREGLRLTLGGKGPAADDASAFGAQHVVCASGDCVVDEAHRIASTPAYMHDEATLMEVWGGIRQMTKALKQWLT